MNKYLVVYNVRYNKKSSEGNFSWSVDETKNEIFFFGGAPIYSEIMKRLTGLEKDKGNIDSLKIVVLGIYPIGIEKEDEEEISGEIIDEVCEL